MGEHFPLPTLLSQALVAFTIDFDNESEHRMPHRATRGGATAGSLHAPWLVSLAMWANCMRSVGEGGIAIGELVGTSYTIKAGTSVFFADELFEIRLERQFHMTWIKTLSLTEADEKLRHAIEGEKMLYPKEYAEPVHPDASGASSIVGSHTLIPQALYHAFSTFGALMSPELPLSRRQHEMIATMVSVTNRCVY